jgi:hypothetical protein
MSKRSAGAAECVQMSVQTKTEVWVRSRVAAQERGPLGDWPAVSEDYRSIYLAVRFASAMRRKRGEGRRGGRTRCEGLEAAEGWSCACAYCGC